MNRKIHIERMGKVVHYIENNLDSEINVNKLSVIACYSEFHFYRLFRAHVGESVFAYKKRLLLERAMKHLQYSNDNMTEIAFKCGYENQSSFNKAFKRHFKRTPSEIRQQNISVKDNIQTNIKRSILVKPIIEMLEDIPVIYARATGGYAESTAEAWGILMKFSYSNRLMNKNVMRIGVSHDDPGITDADHIRYDACINIDADITSEAGLKKGVIVGGKYAKFLHKGAYENFNQTYAAIFNDWLPESGLMLRDKPCFERYLNLDPRRTKPENLKTEIFVPIEVP